MESVRQRRLRPGGRTARVRDAVLASALEVLGERGYEATEVPEIARRAGVHPTTIYRRWRSKAPLIGEAMLQRPEPLTPTPDTSSLQGDLENLLIAGGALLESAPVRALLQVLVGSAGDLDPELAHARERFWQAHAAAAGEIVGRAEGRGELPLGTDPETVIELLIGQALVHTILAGRRLEAPDATAMSERAIAAVVHSA